MWMRIGKDIETGELFVIEVTDIDPTGRFHSSVEWLKCPKGTKVGTIYKNGKLMK